MDVPLGGDDLNIETTLRYGTRAAFALLRERKLSAAQIMELVSRRMSQLDAMFGGQDSAEVVLAVFYYAVTLCVRNKTLHN